MREAFTNLEGRPLQLQWADQFADEAERSIHEGDIAAVARTVLFYAGLQLEMLFPPANGPQLQGAVTDKDWMLASEDEIVQAALERDPRVNRRLLELSLYTVKPSHVNLLSVEEKEELRAYAGPYIRSARERLHRIAGQWFH